MTEEMEYGNTGDRIGIFRLLDANFNRSFEAFRVVEDIIRFSYDNILLTEMIKEMRHGLKAVAIAVGREMVTFRDVITDVGTGFTNPDEETRQDCADVMFVNFGRLKESLRTIEEGVKVIMPAASVAVKKLRYQVYELEKRSAALVQPMPLLENAFLYVIVSGSEGGNPLGVVREAIAGGAEAVQLRDKEMGAAELLKLARGIREITASEGALFIVNDYIDIAILSHADGVHLGQGDMPPDQARKLLGPGRIIGVSSHSPDEAEEAVSEGADYVAVGAMFATDTKDDAKVGGVDLARAVRSKIKKIPLFAIGGINAGNLPKLLDAGIRRVAVSGAITGAPSVREAAEEMRNILSSTAGES